MKTTRLTWRSGCCARRSRGPGQAGWGALNSQLRASRGCDYGPTGPRPHPAWMVTILRLHYIVHRCMGRNRRGPGVARASARAALAAWAAILLASSPVAHACGYHDPAGASVGMLNWAYPDALHVRTAVWMAQASGVLAARESLPAADPQSATDRLQQMVRWRETQSRLVAVQGRIHAALDGQPMPAFAVVLIGPMLWTRFVGGESGVTMVPHAAGPAQDDVVIVTDEGVIAALAKGRITAREARAQGLVKAYGARERVERLSALLDRSFECNENQMSQAQLFTEAP